MIISYQRENDRNYMVPEFEVPEESTASLRILEESPSDRFLRPVLRLFNGSSRILYDITGKQNILRLYENQPISGETLLLLFEGLNGAMLECERYLMDSADLLLDPETIYLNSSKRNVFFCYLPASASREERRYLGLADFLLKHLDHSDRTAIDLGYRFYDLADTDNFSFLEEWPRLRNQEQKGSVSDLRAAEVRTAGFHATDSHTAGFRTADDCTADVRAAGVPGADPAFGRTSSFPGRMPEEELFLRSGQEYYTDMEEKSGGRDRRKKKTKSRKIQWPVILAVILVSAAVYVPAVWFFRLDILQAGGLFFLIAASDSLALSLFLDRPVLGSGGRASSREEKLPDDEEAFFRLLMSEPGDAVPERQQPEKPPEIKKAGFEEPDPYDEGTRFLNESLPSVQVRLVSQNIRRCPDLVPETNPVLIGKNRQEVDLVIGLDVISRIHAKIEVKEQTGQVLLTDMNSTNGTFVDDERLHPNETRIVEDGQKISFATVHFQLRLRRENR